MKKIFLILSMLMFIPLVCLNAQGIHIGVKGGVDFNQSDIDFNGVNIDKKVGFHAGAIIKKDLGIDDLALTGELLFSQQRFSLSEQFTNNAGISYHFRTNSLILPINIRKSFNFSIIKPYVQCGPYAGYILSGNIKYGDGSKSMDFDSTGDRFDFGLNAGIGCELPYNLQFQVSYDLGLKNNKLPIGDDKVSVKNRRLSLSLAYLF